MKRFLILAFSCSSLFLTSCSRYYLTCDRQSRHKDYLASSFAKSPDPISKEEITGEQLVISWHVPKSFENKAECELYITYWDYTQESITFTLKDRLGQYPIENLGQGFEKNKGIIAYKAILKDPEGKVFQTWQHQLYAPLITISDEEVDLKEDSMDEENDLWEWESSL